MKIISDRISEIKKQLDELENHVNLTISILEKEIKEVIIESKTNNLLDHMEIDEE